MRALAIFLLLFLAVAWFMSMVIPSLPNLGNPSLNYLESGGISAIVLFFLWEKWGRKESGEHGAKEK
jgi:hypothetical protein